MNKSAMLASAIWILIVGGNIVQVQMISPRVFMDVPQIPWAFAFTPALLVIGAFVIRRRPDYSTARRLVDQRFGEGSFQSFLEVLKPELMFSAMCLGIVLSALARAYLLRTPALPPVVLGFFASGSVAFLIVHLIRRRRETN